mgnify:CR=1 FL=1
MPISELLSLSSCLSIGEAQSLRNLTVVPILDVTRSATGWLTLDHAMERGLAEVTEVSEGGSVPQLGFVNRGDAPVFLLDGEELVGAKQNRILNLSLLVPGNTLAPAAGPIPVLGAALTTVQEGLVTPAPEAGILTSGTAHHPFANDG